MKTTVVSFANSLLAEAITQMLNDSSEFQPYRLAVSGRSNNTAGQCEMLSAEMLIAEVSYASGTTVEARISEVKELRKRLPDCKIVLLCDENSTPEIAHDVMLAKKDGLIDAFFYSSVTSKYLLAALTAL
jgi:DNA-binding NarL/FixJ family response regulator